MLSMDCGRFLCAVSFFCFVSQHYAYEFVRNNEGAIDQLLGNFVDLQGYDVTSANYDDSTRSKICELGDENHSMMYTNLEVYETAHTNVTIKVYIPNAVEVQDVSANITVSITVIICATNNNTGDVYYFGQGPTKKSIAVYAKNPSDEVAKCVGMLTKIFG